MGISSPVVISDIRSVSGLGNVNFETTWRYSQIQPHNQITFSGGVSTNKLRDETAH